MNEKELHVIVKELANTRWSLLNEEILRSLHSQLYGVQVEPSLRRVTLNKYVRTSTKGVYSDLEVTYRYEDIGLCKPILVVDEVFLDESNLTEFLSDKVIEDIAKEVEAMVEIADNEAYINFRLEA